MLSKKCQFIMAVVSGIPYRCYREVHWECPYCHTPVCEYCKDICCDRAKHELLSKLADDFIDSIGLPITLVDANFEEELEYEEPEGVCPHTDCVDISTFDDEDQVLLCIDCNTSIRRPRE